MWQYQVETVKFNFIQKFSIFSHNQQLTYAEVIELWQRDRNFRSFFSSLLAESPFKAYFWETPPITISTVNQSFEFVLIDSPQLARVKPDRDSFRQYFTSTIGDHAVPGSSPDREIITFPNLGQDALLIVPCPIAETATYTHLASFVRQAPPSQQHELWQTAGNTIKQRLNDQPMWVSTSGLGVYWLHLRLDSYPKYYNFQPYK